MARPMSLKNSPCPLPTSFPRSIFVTLVSTIAPHRHAGFGLLQSALTNPHPKKSLPMAKKKQSQSMSAAIRDVLKANPKLTAKEVVTALAKKGLRVKEGLVYFVKGRMKGRKGRRKKAGQMVARVTATGNSDPVATILKVKRWAEDVGGIKQLKALVDALSE